jgi:hypothetical protein
MMKGRTIDLQGHCLVYCHGSRLLIERDPYWRIVGPGDGVLLSDTSVRLSELPVEEGASGGFLYYFFGDEALAEIVPMHSRAHALMFRSAEYPSTDGIIPIQKLPLERVYNPEVGAKGLLHPLLTVIFNTIYLPLWKLCLHRVVIPRIRIQIFLENLVLRPLDRHGAILAQYPGGKNALLREMRRLNMGSVAAIVEQRRLELCLAWHGYGGRQLDDVIRALCVAHPGSFRAKYERWVADEKTFKFSGLGTGYTDTLLAAHPPYIPSLRGKYWLVRDYEMDVLPRHKKRMESDEIYRGQIEHATDVVARDPSILEGGLDSLNPLTPSKQVGQVDPMFWDMESTGIGMIIESEGLASIPGLEDCADLLMAA